MATDDIQRVALEVAADVSKLDESEQYGLLFAGLERFIEIEKDKHMLALMAAQLSRLARIAIDLSGYPVIPDTLTETMN